MIKNEDAKAKTKWKKYPDIPAIIGCVYYFLINGKQHTVMCCGIEEHRSRKIVILHDLNDAYVYRWDQTRFAYMLRQKRWKDPLMGTIGKIEVEHMQKRNESVQIKTRDYSKEDLSELVDDIDDVEF